MKLLKKFFIVLGIRYSWERVWIFLLAIFCTQPYLTINPVKLTFMTIDTSRLIMTNKNAGDGNLLIVHSSRILIKCKLWLEIKS